MIRLDSGTSYPNVGEAEGLRAKVGWSLLIAARVHLILFRNPNCVERTDTLIASELKLVS